MALLLSQLLALLLLIHAVRDVPSHFLILTARVNQPTDIVLTALGAEHHLALGGLRMFIRIDLPCHGWLLPRR